MRHFAGFAVVWMLVALGCAKRSKSPDLGQLYNAAASHYDKDRNPVIVIPGILGSKLVDEATGQVVWGAFGGDALDPTTEEGARIFALPLATDKQNLLDVRDSVKPNGVLDTMNIKFLGLPLQLNAYLQILRTLGAGGYRDQNLGLSGALDYGDDHFTCFQFDYDWRRDLSETAARLDAFIKEKQAFVREAYKQKFGVDKPVKFDIVAHSMGGLITRYYLRYGNQGLDALGENPVPNWQGAQHVEKVVLVGTPNAGSLGALANLIEGRKLAPFLPRYQPALLGTFPSVYQLLPRPRHRTVFERSNGDQRVVNHLEPDLWHRMQWGLANPKARELLAKINPSPTTKASPEAYLERMLTRAKRFFKAMDAPANQPAHLSLYLVAGDAEKTPATLEIDTVAKTHRIASQGPGDGTVLRTSVLMDERQSEGWVPKLKSPIPFQQVLLLNKDHLGMTKDPIFTDNILFFLLEAP